MPQWIILTWVKIHLFYTKRGEGMISCSKLLGSRILYSCGCQHSSGRDVPVKLNKTSLFTILWFFISLYKRHLFHTFKSQALETEPWEWAFMYVSGYRQYSCRQRCRTSMTKHQQQSTNVRPKGIDTIRSQIWSSPIYIYIKTYYSLVYVS